MTVDAAQAELLKLLAGGSGTSAGLGGLLRDLTGTSGLGESLTGTSFEKGPGSGGTGLLGRVLASTVQGGTGVRGSLFSLSPIVAGLRALLGGNSQTALPELVKYSAPEPLNLNLGLSDGGVGAVTYGQRGSPRLAPAITVNINAIDSKSFSDHSETIARAVREAMLNSGALTDVMNEI